MKKRIVSAVVAICLVLGSAAALPQNAFIDSASVSASTSLAPTGKCGDNVGWSFKDGVLTIIGSGKMYDYSYGGLMCSPFRDLDDINTIIIEKGVTSIGDYAFSDCGNLSEVVIPNGVKSIGKGAFEFCTSLSVLNIPDEVTKIGESAFCGCFSLISVVIPDAVNEIKESTFKYCYALNSVQLPKSLTTIGIEAFYDCESLRNISLPAKVTDIYSRAFDLCTNLSKITVDMNNSRYCSYDGALYNKTLTKLELCPEGKTSIDFPQSVKTIEEYAFSDNKNLLSVNIPAGVTTIGTGAFTRCTSLKDITIPNTVTDLGSYAFSGCKSLTTINIPNSITTIGSNMFYESGLTNITIPDSVTSIGERAFSNCGNLTYVTIANSVTNIDSFAFAYCKNLTNINLPDSVKRIGANAFLKCEKLTSVSIPNSITTIEFGLFGDCHSLSEVRIPSSVTTIEECAFCHCENLKRLTIPSSVTKIERDAFYLTYNFEPVYVTLYGMKGSAAQQHADSYNIPFVEIGSRLAGKGRFDTAVEISKAGFEKADTVVLAYGLGYADALAGVPLASSLNAPILLTNKDKIGDETLDEIKRLGATKVVILGGEGAVSSNVVETLVNNGIAEENIERIAGSNRYGTATAVAEKLTNVPTDVFFVFSNGFADALSVSAVAAAKGAPIIYLNNKGELDQATADYLASIKESVKNAYVIGGTGVISDDMLNKAGDALGVVPTRVFGANRYDTCIAVNDTFAGVLSGESICVATGADFPDALAGGVLAAQKKAPLFLAAGKLSDSQKAYIKARAPKNLYVFGGTGAVPNKLVDEITLINY